MSFTPEIRNTSRDFVMDKRSDRVLLKGDLPEDIRNHERRSSMAQDNSKSNPMKARQKKIIKMIDVASAMVVNGGNASINQQGGSLEQSLPSGTSSPVSSSSSSISPLTPVTIQTRGDSPAITVSSKLNDVSSPTKIAINSKSDMGHDKLSSVSLRKSGASGDINDASINRAMNAVEIRMHELRKQREEINAIDLKRMEEDLLYKLLLTEDIEFKRNYLMYLSSILDEEYANMFPPGSISLGQTLRNLVHSSSSLPTSMSVWNTFIIAGLYMESKFVSHFMPHLIEDIYGNRNIREILAPARTKLIPSMKVFESAGGINGSIRYDLFNLKSNVDALQAEAHNSVQSDSSLKKQFVKRRKITASVAPIKRNDRNEGPKMTNGVPLNQNQHQYNKNDGSNNHRSVVDEVKFSSFIRNYIHPLMQSFENNDVPGSGSLPIFSSRCIGTYIMC